MQQHDHENPDNLIIFVLEFAMRAIDDHPYPKNKEQYRYCNKEQHHDYANDAHS